MVVDRLPGGGVLNRIQRGAEGGGEPLALRVVHAIAVPGPTRLRRSRRLPQGASDLAAVDVPAGEHGAGRIVPGFGGATHMLFYIEPDLSPVGGVSCDLLVSA